MSAIASPTKPERARAVRGTAVTLAAPARYKTAISVALGSLSLICAIGLIATSAWLISRASEQPPILALGVAVVTVRACGLGRGIFRYCERLTSHNAALSGLTRLRQAIVQRLSILSPASPAHSSHGDTVRRLVDDVDNVAQASLRMRLPAYSALVVGAALTTFLWWLLPPAAIVMLTCLLVAGIVAPLIAARSSHRATADIENLNGDMAALIASTLRHSSQIAVLNAQEKSLNQIHDIDNRLTHTTRRIANISGIAVAVGIGAQMVALIGLVLVAVPAVANNELPGIDLALILLLPLAAFEIVAPLPAGAIAWLRARASAARIDDILLASDPHPDPAKPAIVPPSPSGPFIRARDLSACWPGSNEAAIADINLDIRPGVSIAIVGPSGAGKSTLAAALANLITFTGNLTVNGESYENLTGSSVRELVGLCPQNSHVFDNTLAANIRLAKPTATDEEVQEAAQNAGLGLWLANSAHGIATQVGSNGAAMSGGERRRVAIARSLLAARPISIFDEPTEHLDGDSAELITQTIMENHQRSGGSVVVITHALQQLDCLDHIVVIESGHITAQGSFAQLSTQDGWFATNLATPRNKTARAETMLQT